MRRQEPASAPSGRSALEKRRERLFASLAALDAQHRRGEIDEERYGEQRQELVASLGRVYVELDRQPAA